MLLDEIVRVRVAAQQLARQLVRRPPRAVRLDVPASRAGALAGLTVLDDHHVAELGVGAEERAARDHPAADAGAEREHTRSRDAAPGTEP